MPSKLNKYFSETLSAVITIGIALLIGAVIIIISGNSPIEAYTQLVKGAFSTPHRFMETLVKTIPLLIMALGVSIAFKNQIWNIGGDGQFTIGAIFALFVGVYLGLPPVLAIPLSLVAGMVGGALWGGLAGYFKAAFNANEVITTLMLNYIATLFLSYLVYGPMMDPTGGGFPQTPLLSDAMRLPLFLQNERLHAGLFVAVILVVVMLFFWRSTLGFRIELMGQGEGVSKYAGVNAKGTMIIAMMLSGGLMGIASWVEVYGVHYRLMTDIAGGLGSISIIIALLGNLNPIGIAVSAFFFAALMVGGNTMQRMTDVPYSIVDIIQGLIIIFVVTRAAFSISSVKEFFRRIGGKKSA